MLCAAQAQQFHGQEGDGCWNPAVCYSRRSYARNRDRINQTRSRLAAPEQIPVEFEPLSEITFAVLIVYRPAGADTPVHATGVEIWHGLEKIAVVPSIHCIGMVSSQVHAYIRQLLSVLEQRYGIKKFAALTRLDPHLCPIRPCPLHSVG